MQILLFVMTMLLLLGAITYTKLENYKSVVLFRKGFAAYSEARNNSFEKEFYEKVFEKKVGESKGTQDQKHISDGFANISLKGGDFSKQLLKDLLPILYGEKKFYQDLLKLRPELASDIVEALAASLQKKPIRKTEEIAHIEFDDPMLSEAFYKMQKGFETKNDEGYPQIGSYLTMKGTGKIRAYLAPKAILKVIFDDIRTVEEVIRTRDELYSQYTNDAIKEPEATTQFKETFSQALKGGIPPEMVDFTVSKTNPKSASVRYLQE